MTLSQVLPFWKEAPFIRLIVPFLVGITLEQQLQISRDVIWIVLLFLSFFLFCLRSFSLFTAYRFNWIKGVIIHLFLVAAGFLVAKANDGTQDQHSLLNEYKDSSIIHVTIQEPLQEKSKSFKTTASVDYLSRHDSILPAAGNIILYFSKQQPKSIRYGTTLMIRKALQPIRNAGNPGGFDYRKYCLRKKIYYSVFLSEGDYRILEGSHRNIISSCIYALREKILKILSDNIQSERESGFAKALLIGYTDDLDKELIQSYSNTGVVHIIAISGLHLGIIFALLNIAVSPMRKKKYSQLVAVLILMAGLWGFSFLAGGGPSVIRSAFMFSFVVIGNAISKRSNILNNLAASAFILLCIRPFWLWDLGFQLSYAAVLSIVLFYKPIYHWFYFPNKIVDFAWKLNAVTLSAQVLTIPICVYQFHQLPVYFLLSNLLAVPWSSFILLGEIMLCCFAFIPSIAGAIGVALQWLIFGLNDYIERVSSLPFAVWSPLQVSAVQLALIFALITALSLYTLKKIRIAFIAALTFLFFIVLLRSRNFIDASRQRKIIVYNIPKTPAIDFLSGRSFSFVGEDSLKSDQFLVRSYFQPSRSLFHVLPSNNSELQKSKSLIGFCGKLILIANSHLSLPSRNISIDVIILSQDVRVDLQSLILKTHPKFVVADGSNHSQTRNQWKNVCNSLQVAYHDVVLDGAFQCNLN